MANVVVKLVVVELEVPRLVLYEVVVALEVPVARLVLYEVV